jgi:hypothetical protein
MHLQLCLNAISHYEFSMQPMPCLAWCNQIHKPCVLQNRSREANPGPTCTPILRPGASVHVSADSGRLRVMRRLMPRTRSTLACNVTQVKTVHEGLNRHTRCAAATPRMQAEVAAGQRQGRWPEHILYTSAAEAMRLCFAATFSSAVQKRGQRLNSCILLHVQRYSSKLALKLAVEYHNFVSPAGFLAAHPSVMQPASPPLTGHHPSPALHCCTRAAGPARRERSQRQRGRQARSSRQQSSRSEQCQVVYCAAGVVGRSCCHVQQYSHYMRAAAICRRGMFALHWKVVSGSQHTCMHAAHMCRGYVIKARNADAQIKAATASRPHLHQGHHLH